MKTVVWYLPSGAGGMAAQHRSYQIRTALVEWANHQNIDINFSKQLTFTSENGLRYYSLELPDEHAIIFALSWDNTIPKTHYEYIR